MTTDKDEKQAAETARAIKAFIDKYKTPAYRDLMMCMASEMRLKYLAFVDSGFTEQQAIDLLRPKS